MAAQPQNRFTFAQLMRLKYPPTAGDIHPADLKSIALAERMGWPLVFDRDGIPSCAKCDREIGDCSHTLITCDDCGKQVGQDEWEDNAGVCFACYEEVQ